MDQWDTGTPASPVEGSWGLFGVHQGRRSLGQQDRCSWGITCGLLWEGGHSSQLIADGPRGADV